NFFDMFSLLPLGGAPTGCDISTSFSDSEAAAVYDKCASYTCQTVRFGKVFGPMMRITFVLALLLSTFGPSRAIAQNTPDMVTHPTGSDSGSVSSGWSDRFDRSNCRSAAQ